ncbi:MAG TPA: DUF349 domain-containing protein [Fulvivirga sp.]|nr:DUF349 domain-containing protein [Fulvivirga sp.]
MMDKVKESKELEQEIDPSVTPQEGVENVSQTEVEAHADEDSPPVTEKKELTSEEDLAEKDDQQDQEEEEEEVDYSSYSKEQLVELIRTLAEDSKVIKAEKLARVIKPYFDEIKDKEREEALTRFKAEGGIEEDFDFKYDELTNRFEANFKLIRDNKTKYIREQESRKDENLKKKQDILERLREYVDSEETNASYDTFKEIQKEWSAVGPIPGAYVKTLWANYNALVDRFYDNRSIYFELKELDRKKNLELKYELCEKAEELSKKTNINEAIKELNELHHEFKHLGPVPNEEREALWQRFKTASDAVYDQRKEYVDQLKVELEANLKIKEELVAKVTEFTAFDSDKIKEWNGKTKELQKIQEQWEATGGVPRTKSKEINRAFWSGFKTFYSNKGSFFKRLDAQREGNLEKKKELVQKAIELKESTDWQKTANEYKNLQSTWREIGPVPEKQRESIYREFKGACDYFFNQKRASLGEAEKSFGDNLKVKEAICEEIVKMAVDKVADLDKFRELQAKYAAAGFVPKSSMSSIKSKYSEAVDKYINSIDVTNEERQQIRLENQINRIAQGPNSGEKIFRKEQNMRKQISHLENDIALWKNNLEFFAESKTADKLKKEFNDKIKAATVELKGLKHQLKIVRQMS